MKGGFAYCRIDATQKAVGLPYLRSTQTRGSTGSRSTGMGYSGSWRTAPGKVGTVLVEAPDRLSRDIGQLIDLLIRLHRGGGAGRVHRPGGAGSVCVPQNPTVGAG
jgi:hypothetical protein